MDVAIKWYKASCDSQNEWPQFHHVCYWELVWAHQFCRNWWGAYDYATMLFEESKWSRCFYAYQRAAMMCMVQANLSVQQREEQIELMRNVPNWKQRIAGKSLPMEKFAIRKADRFLTQGNFLVLPALELIYVWNGFKVLGKSWAMMEPIYILVEKAMEDLQKDKGNVDKKNSSTRNWTAFFYFAEKRSFYKEDFCLITLLRGMCLKFMNSPLQAEECFSTVIGFKGQLSRDTYLVPYAMFERSLLLSAQGLVTEAMELMERTK